MKAFLACVLFFAFLSFAHGQLSDPSSLPLQWVYNDFLLYNVNISAYCGVDYSHPLKPLKCNRTTGQAQIFNMWSDVHDAQNLCYMTSPTIPSIFDMNAVAMPGGEFCLPQSPSDDPRITRDQDVFCNKDALIDDYYLWVQLVKTGGWLSWFIYPADDKFVIKNSITGKYCNGDATGFHCDVPTLAQAYRYVAFFHVTSTNGAPTDDKCDAY